MDENYEPLHLREDWTETDERLQDWWEKFNGYTRTRLYIGRHQYVSTALRDHPQVKSATARVRLAAGMPNYED